MKSALPPFLDILTAIRMDRVRDTNRIRKTTPLQVPILPPTSDRR